MNAVTIRESAPSRREALSNQQEIRFSNSPKAVVAAWIACIQRRRAASRSHPRVLDSVTPRRNDNHD